MNSTHEKQIWKGIYSSVISVNSLYSLMANDFQLSILMEFN